MTGTVAVTGLDDTGDEDDDDTGEDDTDDEDDDEADVVDVEDVGDGSTGGMVIATSAVVTVPSGAVNATETAPGWLAPTDRRMRGRSMSLIWRPCPISS